MQRSASRAVNQIVRVPATTLTSDAAKAGLNNPEAPIGSFIAVGSSGVGKTYSAECLAEDLFDDADALTVFDMSEFMEKHTVARLIGAPPGYAGYGEGGMLTNAVRRRPYQVILLDEVEKA
ncbi:MAG: AAA family ATPase, partial [Acidimicrobiales bacterium]|nr:AAA family ATPase [Acidimicrobiales bacterium]